MSEIKRTGGASYLALQEKIRSNEPISIQLLEEGPRVTNLINFILNNGEDVYTPQTSFHKEKHLVWGEQHHGDSGITLRRWINLVAFGDPKINGYYLEVFDDILPLEVDHGWDPAWAGAYPCKVLSMVVKEENGEWVVENLNSSLKLELISETLDRLQAGLVERWQMGIYGTSNEDEISRLNFEIGQLLVCIKNFSNQQN